MNQNNESKISDDEVINFDDDEIIDFQNFDQVDSNNSSHVPKIIISDAQKPIDKLQIINVKRETKQEQPIIPIQKSAEKQSTTQQEIDPDLLKFKDNLYQPLKEIDFPYGFDQFLTRPAPKGGLIQCRMYRAPPKYTLFIENLNMLILNAHKKSFKLRSSYKIFAKGRKDQYLGKIKSDFMGSKFIIYDNGKTIKKAKDTQDVRNEIGVVYYQPYQQKLRQIQAVIPAINEHEQMYMFKNTSQYCSITKTLEHVIDLENRKPQWIQKFKSYGLNFYGRALQSSVKNFILTERGKETPLLLFGKNDDREFAMDFSYPLSPLQAFAIALSSIDHKFSCR